MHRRQQHFWHVLAGVALIGFFLFLLSSTPAEWTWGRVQHGAMVGLCVLVLALPFLVAGYRRIVPNQVSVTRNATITSSRLLDPDMIIRAGVAGCVAVVGVANTFFNGPYQFGEAGMNGVVMGPGMLGLGIFGILQVLWERLRGVRMTPESLTYWRGFGRITLGWDELGEAIPDDNVLNLRPMRLHWLFDREIERFSLGATIVIPPERAAATRLEVRWDEDGTARLVLDTEHFRVEPSALLTAILAMRDHPELRGALGTRESRAFFVGPPWRVRRHLYRNQQWWPKGAVPEGVSVDADGVVEEPVPRLEIP